MALLSARASTTKPAKIRSLSLDHCHEMGAANITSRRYYWHVLVGYWCFVLVSDTREWIVDGDVLMPLSVKDRTDPKVNFLILGNEPVLPKPAKLSCKPVTRLLASNLAHSVRDRIYPLALASPNPSSSIIHHCHQYHHGFVRARTGLLQLHCGDELLQLHTMA